jgi:hypothetical protein
VTWLISACARKAFPMGRAGLGRREATVGARARTGCREAWYVDVEEVVLHEKLEYFRREIYRGDDVEIAGRRLTAFDRYSSRSWKHAPDDPALAFRSFFVWR